VLETTNNLVKSITGVVETSLFLNLAHKAIVSTNNNTIVCIEKK